MPALAPFKRAFHRRCKRGPPNQRVADSPSTWICKPCAVEEHQALALPVSETRMTAGLVASRPLFVTLSRYVAGCHSQRWHRTGASAHINPTRQLGVSAFVACHVPVSVTHSEQHAHTCRTLSPPMYNDSRRIPAPEDLVERV